MSWKSARTKKAIVPLDRRNASKRGIVAVCSDVEAARLAYVAHIGRNPRIYQRNVHAEDCDTYVHVVIADLTS